MLLDGDPHSGTSSSMMSKAAPFETAEPVELGARSLVSDYDKTVEMRVTASAPQKSAEERDEKRSCPAVSYGRVSDACERECRRIGW
jgi:hypothetical protein